MTTTATTAAPAVHTTGTTTGTTTDTTRRPALWRPALASGVAAARGDHRDGRGPGCRRRLVRDRR